jgi:antitoxin component of MazEF toxin-antitoxin module
MQMKRKIVKTGSSLAVTLPREVVAEFALRAGDEVEVSVHPRTSAIVIRPGVREIEGGQVTKRFKKSVDELVQRRASLYRALAK